MASSRPRPTAVAASYPPLADYALIGDCRTAALVARDGTIAWLCLPNFSAPSVFAGLLDPVRGGGFVLRPRDAYVARRRYLDDTPVLETVFETASGRVRLTDFMSLDGVRSLRPMRELVRVVEGLAGTVDLEVAIALRPDYARTTAHLAHRGPIGWTWTWGNQIAVLRTDADLALRGDVLAAAALRVRAGERLSFSLSYTQGDMAAFPTLGRDVQARLEQAVAWWRGTCDRCSYHGPYRSAVMRSAMVLRMLSHALSGAIVAAPTTSLPEAPGGERNWDYRYCWLRDAGLTTQALVGLGYHEEARAYVSWLLHATRLTAPELNVLYDIYGRTELAERALSHLQGYCGSQPVRIGNDAYRQLQLDVYGETVIAADTIAASGSRVDGVEARVLRGLGDTVCRQWRKPDSGIWERRAPPRHYTLSKVMCWAALDRLLKMEARGVIPAGTCGTHFAAERDEIARTIETSGFNPGLNAYVSTLDGEALDASLLLLACIGYKDAGDPRMRATYAAITDRLGTNGLLYRYLRNDGLPHEGAFGICSFWAVDNLAARGELDEAVRLFEHLLGFASDLGLFGEEIDPRSGAVLGNFPQGFTHIGLINAALAIERARSCRS